MDRASVTQGLLEFLAASPTAWHAVAAMRKLLDAEGFSYLGEGAAWKLVPGGCYYTVRNGSSLIAFRVGEDGPTHFQMAAAHTDSPAFKLKSRPELVGPEGYLRLNVEAYGNMLDHTWLDRPLSVAGRVMVAVGEGQLESRLVAPDRDLFLIPSVAIHMNRKVNEGFAWNRQVDLCPLASAGALEEGAVASIVADELGVSSEQVKGFDLMLVNRQRPCVWGAAGEFVSAPRLDDLQSVYAALTGFLAAGRVHGLAVLACFDNEEVGSGTKQGAKSTFLHDTLVRATLALGGDMESYLRAVARSFLVSCDNAHAVHPNHPEHADPGSRPCLNGGVVVKEHAGQLYTTDAFSRAVFQAVCERAGVPWQPFANRSDKRGGSTLGNLSNQQVSVHAVDVGLAQLAMHSAYETAGAEDTAWAAEALKTYFECDLDISAAERVVLC